MDSSFEKKTKDFHKKHYDGFLGKRRPEQLDHEVNEIRHVLNDFLDLGGQLGQQMDATLGSVEAACAKAAADATEALEKLTELGAIRRILAELTEQANALATRVNAIEQDFRALESDVREGGDHFKASVLAILRSNAGDILADHDRRIRLLEESAKNKFPATTTPQPLQTPNSSLRPQSTPRVEPIPFRNPPFSPPQPTVGSYSSYELEGVTSTGKKIALKLREASFAKRNGSLTLGSAAEKTHVQFNDPTVAAIHAVLTCRNNALFLRDLGTNGRTIVDGQPLKRDVDYPVKPGATITLGKLRFSLKRCK